MMTSDIIDILCLVWMAEGRYVLGFVLEIMDKGNYIRFSYIVDRSILVYYKIQGTYNYKRLPSILHEQG